IGLRRKFARSSQRILPAPIGHRYVVCAIASSANPWRALSRSGALRVENRRTSTPNSRRWHTSRQIHRGVCPGHSGIPYPTFPAFFSFIRGLSAGRAPFGGREFQGSAPVGCALLSCGAADNAQGPLDCPHPCLRTPLHRRAAEARGESNGAKNAECSKF